MSDPNFLDIDALEPPTARSIKYGGESHFVVPISVENWLANLQDVRELQAFMSREDVTPDQVARKNLEVTAASLHRAFPTIPADAFMQMEMHKLDAVVKFVRATDGAEKVEDAIKAEVAAANPPGPSTTA